MFKPYDEQSCLFECRLEHAIGKSGCVPWDYPNPLDDEGRAWSDFEICTASIDKKENKLALFEEMMNNGRESVECDCLPNCEETAYRTQVSHCPSAQVSQPGNLLCSYTRRS